MSEGGCIQKDGNSKDKILARYQEMDVMQVNQEIETKKSRRHGDAHYAAGVTGTERNYARIK